MSQTTGTLPGVFQAGMPVQRLGPSPSAQAGAAVSLTTGIAYDVTLTQGTAFSLRPANAAVIQQVTLILRQSGNGGFMPILPANVMWTGNLPPTPNSIAGNIDWFTFMTPDGGATWFGVKMI